MRFARRFVVDGVDPIHGNGATLLAGFDDKAAALAYPNHVRLEAIFSGEVFGDDATGGFGFGALLLAG
jgi:hypothetical protein